MKAGFGSFDLGAVGARLHPSGLGRVPRVPGSLNPDFSKTFSCTGPALFIREAAPLSFLGTRSLLPPDQLHSFFFSPWSASWYSSDCCSYGLTLAAATSIVPPSPSGNAPIKRLYFQISPPKTDPPRFQENLSIPFNLLPPWSSPPSGDRWRCGFTADLHTITALPSESPD